MNKRHFPWVFISQTLLCTSLVLLGNSCIDNKYDLNKDISMVIGIGGELGIPLGETEEKALRDLLGPDDIADLDTTDGAYGLHKKEDIIAKIERFDDVTIDEIDASTDFKITFKTLTIDPISFPENEPDITMSKEPISRPEMNITPIMGRSDLSTTLTLGSFPEGVIPEVKITLRRPDNVDFEISNIFCPTEITSISSVVLGSQAKLEWDLSDIKNKLRLSSGTITLTDFQINFPEGFVLSNPSKGKIVGDNVLSLVGEQLPCDRNIITFTLERYEKTIQNQNGSISGFTEEITYSGDLKFSISGVTTGTDAGDCNISMPLVLSCSPQVSDMHMSLSGVNVDVPQTVISNEVDITGINEEVTKINKVYFDESSKITVTSSPLNLGELALRGNNALIDFSSKLTFAPDNNTWDNGKLVITPSEIKNGFTKTVTLQSIDLSGEELSGTNNSKSIHFEPDFIVGSMKLTVSGNTTFSGLQEFNNNLKVPVKVTSAMLDVVDADVETSAFTSNLEEHSADIDIKDVSIPDKIEDLGWVQLKSPSKISLAMDVNPIPEGAGEMRFQNLNIDFPAFIELESDQKIEVHKDQGGNVLYRRLVLDGKGAIFTKNSVTRSWTNAGMKLNITKLDLTQAESYKLIEGKLSLSEVIKVSGNVVLGEGSISLTDLQGDINVDTKVSVAPMEVGIVACRVKENVTDENPHTKIDLGDLSDYLKEGSKLYLPKANFKLKASNPLGVPVDVDLVFKPYKNGRLLLMDAPSVPVSINAYQHVEDISNADTTRLMIVGKEYPENIPAPEGYTKIQFDRLSEVIEQVPDSIIIDAYPKADAPVAGSWHMVNLDRPNNDMDIKCEVGVPFALGDNINIVYCDTIDNIQDDLDDIFDKVTVSEIILNVKVTNGVPLNLKLKVIPLGPDAEEPISSSDLKVLFDDNTEGNIAAGSYDFDSQKTEPTETTVQIKIIEVNGSNALKRLDGLELKIEGGLGDQNKGTEGGVPLKTSQSIKAKVGLKVKGIQADMNEF